MHLASYIWVVGDDTCPEENAMPDINEDDIEASLVAARASQRKDKSGPLSVPQ